MQLSILCKFLLYYTVHTHIHPHHYFVMLCIYVKIKIQQQKNTAAIKSIYHFFFVRNAIKFKRNANKKMIYIKQVGKHTNYMIWAPTRKKIHSSKKMIQTKHGAIMFNVPITSPDLHLLLCSLSILNDTQYTWRKKAYHTLWLCSMAFYFCCIILKMYISQYVSKW